MLTKVNIHTRESTQLLPNLSLHGAQIEDLGFFPQSKLSWFVECISGIGHVKINTPKIKCHTMLEDLCDVCCVCV